MMNQVIRERERGPGWERADLTPTLAILSWPVRILRKVYGTCTSIGW